MSKIPIVERFSPRLVHRCKPPRIPLTRPECGINSSAINKYILKWKQLNYQKLAYLQKIPAKKRSKVKMQTNFTMNLLPDYSREIEPKKDPPVKSYNLIRDLKYITTDEYKRISPEFYKLLTRFNKQTSRKKDKSKMDQVNFDGSHNVPDWALLNPNLYNYLRNVMDSENPSNMIYGIDYADNFDPEERDIAKLFSNQRMALDIAKALQLFQILQSRETLTPEQFQFLSEFLRKFAYMGSGKFDNFLALLKAAGLEGLEGITMRDYIRILYQDIQPPLGQNQLDMVLSKLGINDDKAKMYGESSNDISHIPSHFPGSKMSGLHKSAHDSNISELQKNYENSKNISQHKKHGEHTKTSHHQKHGVSSSDLDDANLTDYSKSKWWGVVAQKDWSVPKPSIDDIKIESDTSYLMYDQKPSDTNIHGRIRLSRAKLSRPRRSSTSYEKPASSSNIYSEQGYYTPWDVVPQWKDVQKFYRLSTVKRRSFF